MMKSLPCFTIMTLILIGPDRSAQAAALNRAEQTIANFSFASQLGSGIDSINGRHRCGRKPQCRSCAFSLALPFATFVCGSRIQRQIG